jgi:NADP-dependent aldehyde dehydrogenase
MTRILGHNFIGGQRSALGTVKLQSVDAETGEALPHDFFQATPAKSRLPPRRRQRHTRLIAA